ncbi:integrase catalytic domain-containing protein [Trichonephila clavipes]|nr:integrase catalytic domain-containing protein [Trichonephila clavipes]
MYKFSDPTDQGGPTPTVPISVFVTLGAELSANGSIFACTGDSKKESLLPPYHRIKNCHRKIRLTVNIKNVKKVRGFTSEKTVSNDTSVTEIEIKLKKIEQLQINLDKIAEDYCEIEIFESLEIIQLDIEGINQRIETTEVGLKLLMYSLKNSENVNINLNDNGKNSIRLPQIPLPEFSGVIAEFSNFKNQFINLISNEQLNDSQKLYYLRASLKGEAKLLESPSDSFDSLFKALEDRYENKRQLIDSHVLEIINYEKIYSESAKELRALMDCINRNIRALKSFEI